MPVRNDHTTRFSDEVALISPWAWCIAVFFFLALVTGFGLLVAFAQPRPPAALLLPMGIFAGFMMGSYVLLIGYINRDAGRRGMSRTLWTIIAILVPNALGVVLYFVLRKPRVNLCPQCGAPSEQGFSFCPVCACRLNAVCRNCQRSVNTAGAFCPYCGVPMQPPAPAETKLAAG